MRWSAIAITLLCGCGEAQRLRVESMTLLADPVADLDGDGTPDNQLGEVFAALRAQDLTDERAGASQSMVEVTPSEIRFVGVLEVPFFRDAAPLVVPITARQIDLDQARLDGVVRFDVLVRALFPGFDQMMGALPSANPTRLVLVQYLDRDGDGTVSLDEFVASALVRAALTPDVGDSLSFSAAMTLGPAPAR